MMSQRKRVIKGATFKDKAIEVAGGAVLHQLAINRIPPRTQAPHRDKSQSPASTPHSSAKTNSFDTLRDERADEGAIDAISGNG